MGKHGLELEIATYSVFSEVRTAKRAFFGNHFADACSSSDSQTSSNGLGFIASKTAAPENARSGISMIIAVPFRWIATPPTRSFRDPIVARIAPH